MAVLETLRKRAGVLLVAAIAVALLSFILGDMFGSKSNGGGLFSSRNVGEIRGKKIAYEDYLNQVEYYTEIYRIMYGKNSGNEALTEDIREQAWLSFVRRYAFDPEVENLSLAVSGDELFDLVQGRNPSPLVIRNFSNPQTGEFDRANILLYLQNLENNTNPDAKAYWLFLEKEIVSQRLQTKVQNLVSKALYTTTLEVQDAVSSSARTADINYVVRSISGIADSLVEVSSSDIKKYYKENKKKYKQITSCDIEYVSFSIAPSAADDEAVKGWISGLEPLFKESADVRQFVMQHSDVAFNATYYKKSELEGTIADFAFEKTKADLLEPFIEEGVYKMVRIADVRNLPDSVKARHILLTSSNGLDAARKLADTIKTKLQKGADFKALAEEYSVDKVANQEGGDLGWFTQKAMVKPFGDSCFFAPKGKIMVVETQYGVHVVEVVDKKQEEKKVQLAIVEREVRPSSETRARLFANANEIATESKDEKSFLEVLAQKNASPRMANKITINDKGIQGLQSARELVRWACKAKKGIISPVFEVDNHFVVAVVTQQRKEGFAPVEQVTPEITSILRQQKKAELLAAELSGEKNLDALAAKFNLTALPAGDISFSSFFIPGLGIEPNLSAAVSVSPAGSVASPVIGNSGVFAYEVTATHENPAPEGAAAAEKRRMQNIAAQRAAFETFNVIRTAADIKDTRGELVY